MPSKPKPVSDRQRNYFRHQLDSVMSGEQPASPKALAYIKAMSGEEEVRHIELSDEEGKALLDRLRKESRLRRGQYTIRGKDKPQQACRLQLKNQLMVSDYIYSLMIRSLLLRAAR